MIVSESDNPLKIHANNDPTVGRLTLWLNAIDKVISLLLISKKAIERWDALWADLEDPSGYLSNNDVFDHDDLLEIHQSCLALAAVYLHQLYASGEAAAGKISSNTGGEMQNIRREMNSYISGKMTGNQIDSVLSEIKEYRDSYVAHASGKLFEVFLSDFHDEPIASPNNSEYANTNLTKEKISKWFDMAQIMKSFIKRKIEDQQALSG